MALSRGLKYHQYLDDWLIRSPSREEALVNTQTVVDLTQSLGWIINQEKSELKPTQVFLFVGYEYHLDTVLVKPTQDRWLKLQDLILRFEPKRVLTARCLMSLIGLLASTEKMVPEGRLHVRPGNLNSCPLTIDGYRTAIVDTLGPVAHHIAQSSDLHRLLTSFHRDRPKSSRNLPKWNLSLLNELTKAPFEPMKDTDLKHLTLKTAFLLALASGKRRSEIHAWVENKVSNLGQWEKVALFPSSDFIVKIQLAREGSQSVSPVTIPALNTNLDRQFKEDRTLCPVRALRYYLDRTKDLRGSRSLLFISFNKGHSSDIRPATLSSWLKQTILLCYKQADQQSLDLV